MKPVQYKTKVWLEVVMPKDSPYYYDLTLDVVGTYGDVGIGAYEFWGARYTDSHYDWAEIDFSIDGTVIRVDEDGNTLEMTPDDALSTLLCQTISDDDKKMDYIIEQLNKKLPEEREEPEYEPVETLSDEEADSLR